MKHLRFELGFFERIKYAYQRARYGFCDSDLWEIDTWFTGIMPKMLTRFEKVCNGYPHSVRLEYFEAHKDEYAADIKHFEENVKPRLYITWEQYFLTIYNDSDGHINAYNDIWHGIIKRMSFLFAEAERVRHSSDKEAIEYREKCTNEGLDLFKKYFYDLWW